MNAVGEASTGIIPFDGDRIAGLVRPLVDLEALPAILEHLRHEGHAIQSTLLVKRPQDFVLAADFDPITCMQLAHGRLQSRRTPPLGQSGETVLIAVELWCVANRF